MKANNINLIIITAAIGIVGCSSPQVKPSVASNSPALPEISNSSYVSARNASLPNPQQCPASEKSWRKENLNHLTDYANNCARLGKFQRVEQIGNWIAQKHSRSAWGPFYLSLAAEGSKAYPRALWTIELAINKSPRTALLYYQKGRILWSLGEFSKSVEAYNTAIKEYPQFADAHLFLAQLYYRDQNFKLADEHFTAVLKAEPENVIAVVGLAETKSIVGDIRTTVELYERAVNLSPRTMSYRFKLAALYENSQKDYAQALSTYKRIKTLLVEARLPANEIPVDVNEKILRLEAVVSEGSGNGEKVSKISEKNQKRVRK